MRTVATALLAPAFLAGCLMRAGDPSLAGSYPRQWKIPGPLYEEKVFGPIPFDEVKDFVSGREAEGWEVIGYESASIREDAMVNTIELDRPARPKRRNEESRGDLFRTRRETERDVPFRERLRLEESWKADLPRTMPRTPEGDLDEPAPKLLGTEPVRSIPPYMDEGVRPHRQKYLVVMRRWL